MEQMCLANWQNKFEASCGESLSLLPMSLLIRIELNHKGTFGCGSIPNRLVLEHREYEFSGNALITPER